jgi:hypothetical protein
VAILVICFALPVLYYLVLSLVAREYGGAALFALMLIGMASLIRWQAS